MGQDPLPQIFLYPCIQQQLSDQILHQKPHAGPPCPLIPVGRAIVPDNIICSRKTKSGTVTHIRERHVISGWLHPQASVSQIFSASHLNVCLCHLIQSWQVWQHNTGMERSPWINCHITHPASSGGNIRLGVLSHCQWNVFSHETVVSYW